MIPDIINFVVIIFYLETPVLEEYGAFAYRNLMERGLSPKETPDDTSVQYIWKWRAIRNEEDR